jgi:hypothetical protein
MTRLAQHILAAARTQGTMVPQQRMGLEVAQAFPQFGGMESHEDPHQHEAPRYAAPEAPQYAQPEVAHYATNGGGNGASHEMAETEMVVETVVEEYEQMAGRPEEMMAHEVPAPAEDEIEAEAPEGSSIAQRFAARRERRRSRKAAGGSGGGSLRDRLRGLVAESPET